MGFVVVHLQMKEKVEESNNHKGKSKKKIENELKNGMIFVVKCGRIIMQWGDFILFILVGCVMDFFGFIFSKLLCDNYF